MIASPFAPIDVSDAASTDGLVFPAHPCDWTGGGAPRPGERPEARLGAGGKAHESSHGLARDQLVDIDAVTAPFAATGLAEDFRIDYTLTDPTRHWDTDRRPPELLRGPATRDEAPMPPKQELPAEGPVARYEQQVIDRITDFNDPRQEWRRLFSELLGTFLLVLVAAGGGMMGHAFPGMISHSAAVVAPGLMVMAIILFMGRVSGAHLNPAVSIAFALRRDFPWWRVPGYIVAQLVGATLAALFLRAVINVSAVYGSNFPAHGYSAGAAFWMELILTMGLVSVILGTASGAQNIGLFGALGVGGYIALAGLWGSPISGASMNPARTFGPDLVSTTFTSYWAYIAGPLAGATLAVGIAFILRGRGGGRAGSGAAQGGLFTEPYELGKS